MSTQTVLATLDKKALVTPRTSHADSKSRSAYTLAKQQKLEACFATMAGIGSSDQGPASASLPSSTRRARHDDVFTSNAFVDDVVSPKSEVAQGKQRSMDRDRQPANTFYPGKGHKILSAARRHPNLAGTSPSLNPYGTPDLGRRVLHPSGSERKRGPTIDFDGPDVPLDDSELSGNSQRLRSNRVVEAGKGELELQPLDDLNQDDQAWIWSSTSKTKRARKSVDIEELPMNHTSARRLQSHQLLRRDAAAMAPPLQVESPSLVRKSTTVGEQYDLDIKEEPTSQTSTSSSQDGDDDLVQRGLLGSARFRDPCTLLVPNSSRPPTPEVTALGETATEDDALCTALAHRLGGKAGAADDSGFAENTQTEPSTCDERDVNGSDDAVWPSPRKKQTAVACPQPSPPPFPPLSYMLHMGSSSDAEEEEQSVYTFLVPNTQASPEKRRASPLPVHEDVSEVERIKVECDAESPMPFSPSRNEFQSVESVTIDEYSTLHMPPPPIPSLQNQTGSVKKRNSDQAWRSLSKAWQGAKPLIAKPLTPERPPSPRQTHLETYFRPGPTTVREEDNAGAADVEDSQPADDGLTLEQAVAFKEAIDFATQRNSKRLATLAEEHEEDDKEEEIQDDEDARQAVTRQEEVVRTFRKHELQVMGERDECSNDDAVPTSDPEDGPPTPIVSPLKMVSSIPRRIVTFRSQDMLHRSSTKSPIKSPLSQRRQVELKKLSNADSTTLPHHAEQGLTLCENSTKVYNNSNEHVPSSQQEEQQQQAFRGEETQWESYWTLEFDDRSQHDVFESLVMPSESLEAT
ncbi:hypothetical protein OIO90_001124 [Microbotryomycetes sp. JL221]|nr:hypothetical protein OIO90_001124 [Microbotryomycetes sp. JL221]